MGTDDVLLTIAAGALGAAVAALVLGASLVLVVPGALGVGAVSLAIARDHHASD